MSHKTTSHDYPHGEPDYWGFYSIDNAPSVYEPHDRIKGATISGIGSAKIETLSSFLRRARSTADVVAKVTGGIQAVGICYGVRCPLLPKIRWYALPPIPTSPAKES